MGESAEISKSVTGLDVKPWSETAPNLYDVVAQLSVDDKVIDDKVDRVGLREVKVKGKPVIVSEFGAGAAPGCRNQRADPWSEEWQCVVLDEALKAYLHHPRIMGTAIWQFCDVRVTRESNPLNGYSTMGRPRCMNNKGAVDEFRRPKLSYESVKAHMVAAEKKRGRV